MQLSILDIVRVTNKDALKRLSHLESSLAGEFDSMRCFKDALFLLILLCSRHFVRHVAAAAEAALVWLFILKGCRGTWSVQRMLNYMICCGGARDVTLMCLIALLESNKGTEQH